jgi:hypothetical protein
MSAELTKTKPSDKNADRRYAILFEEQLNKHSRDHLGYTDIPQSLNNNRQKCREN